MDHEAAPGWDCHVHVFAGAASAQGAHYAPVPRPLPEIEALAQAHGVGHLVLVQPSVYGSDNGLLLDALRRSPGRHRGVVVLRGDEGGEELAAMDAAGVRGIRFNLVSPVGSDRDSVQEQLARLAPVLQHLRWHVQFYARPQDLPMIARLQAPHALPFVLDHLAGMDVAHAKDASAWSALEALASRGSWIKLSGWYRLGAQAPYDGLLPLVRRVADLFGERMVWGSDWPHTSFAPEALPAYDSVWSPVRQALGEAQAQIVREAGARLYR
jgi:predicted TIM-barrel fold metal-dependent hydrolase